MWVLGHLWDRLDRRYRDVSRDQRRDNLGNCVIEAPGFNLFTR